MSNETSDAAQDTADSTRGETPQDAPIIVGLAAAALPAIWLGQLFTAVLPLAITPLLAFATAVLSVAIPATLLIARHARALSPTRYLPWLRRE